MKITPYWPVWLAAFFALLWIAGIEPSHSKTVNVCVDVKLPKPGKCKYMTVHGYKVRVCR